LFGFCCWRSSGYRAKCGSRKNVSEYWDFGLILDAAVLSYCFRTAPSILASQLMVAEELSQLCILLCFLAILCLQVSHCFSILFDPASAFIDW
jgi:hypothetical protein